MFRPRLIAAISLLSASGLGCSGEQPDAATRTLNLPLFGTGDSVAVGVPEGAIRGGRLVGTYTLNDTVIAVVSTAPGGVALVHLRGAPMGSPERLAELRPAYVAPCTRGGIVIITDGERRAIPLSAAGVASDGWRFPPSMGTILGAQCESAEDLVALVDGTMPTIRGAALVRIGAALVRLTDGGRQLDTLGSFPGREILRFSSSDLGVEPPFGVSTRFAAGPTRLYLANTSESTIQLFQTNGRRLGAIDVVAERQKVSRNQIDSALKASVGAQLVTLPLKVHREIVDAMARERTVPLWKALTVDPDENVWATSNEPPDRDGNRAWVVYSADGSRRAKVFLPHDFEVTEVGRAYVLGFFRSAPPSLAARRYGLRLLGAP